jgi:hypothetical protein
MLSLIPVRWTMIMTKFIIIAAAGAGAVVIILFFVLPMTNREDYSLDVDAMRDDQSLFINTRIILANTGKLPLTHITIDYGPTKETLKIIAPGEKVALSPPEGSSLNVVKITADNGINITKEYRKPIKLPGMIGS